MNHKELVRIIYEELCQHYTNPPGLKIERMSSGLAATILAKWEPGPSAAPPTTGYQPTGPDLSALNIKPPRVPVALAAYHYNGERYTTVLTTDGKIFTSMSGCPWYEEPELPQD
jgi:hypothetical protein